jgi:hypothetical protein
VRAVPQKLRTNGGIGIGQHDTAAQDGIGGFETDGAGFSILAIADVAMIEARANPVTRVFMMVSFRV